MSYAESRRIIDVDSHLIELDDFLLNAASPEERTHIPSMSEQRELPVSDQAMARARQHFARRREDPEVMVRFEAALLDNRRSGWSRLGAFDPEERSHTLDLLGFEKQLILPTFAFHQVAQVRHPKAKAVCARVLNRAMGIFCSTDPRLYAIGYVPLALGPEKATALVDEAFSDGCYTVMIDTNQPEPSAHSFTHPVYDQVWDRFTQHQRPFVIHVAVNGEYQAISPSFQNNGRPPLKIGGDAATTPLGFVAIKNSAELFLSAMIFDGVFERHPRLRGISMEHGAFWLPSWLKALDFTAQSLRHLGSINQAPSEVARKHIRVSPFAGEPVGWIIENVGPEMLVFASDYPHPEGTSDPIRKFEATMTECDETTLKAFYYNNMAEWMGLQE
ncbi:MAG: amidohydrolase family protein [Myxococcota bacterium]|nr:amidohydrolase family protein [Myxococcota bacterium]